MFIVRTCVCVGGGGGQGWCVLGVRCSCLCGMREFLTVCVVALTLHPPPTYHSHPQLMQELVTKAVELYSDTSASSSALPYIECCTVNMSATVFNSTFYSKVEADKPCLRLNRSSESVRMSVWWTLGMRGVLLSWKPLVARGMWWPSAGTGHYPATKLEPREDPAVQHENDGCAQEQPKVRCPVAVLCVIAGQLHLFNLPSAAKGILQ